MIETKEQFIALHILKENIAPEEPTNAPVTISRSLPSVKLTAAAASRNSSLHRSNYRQSAPPMP